MMAAKHTAITAFPSAATALDHGLVMVTRNVTDCSKTDVEVLDPLKN